MAVARDLRHEDHAVVAIMGDGALTGGLAYEAINNAGQLGTPLIVVLNDNAMSISPNVGAVARMLERVRTDPRYSAAKGEVREHPAPRAAWASTALGAAKRVKRSVKDLMLSNMFWEELGFTYLGPVDGHDIGRLQEVLRRARSLNAGRCSCMSITTKGKGTTRPRQTTRSSTASRPPGGAEGRRAELRRGVRPDADRDRRAGRAGGGDHRRACAAAPA